jgi:hypothetical protein
MSVVVRQQAANNTRHRKPFRLNSLCRAAQNAAMNKQIQIFKPGKHTAMSGAALSFSETDLAATAKAYDPAKHEAPLVCGHPAHDDPAYGWVGSLSFADGALEADTTQVDTAFAEMVTKGSFKKISASFYSPDSPSNPVPGVYYLRHVGFLGAMPPAVKGLRNPSFADAEQGVVEFSEWDDVDNASLWRSLREWIIGKFGQDEADKVVPGYTVKNLEQSASAELLAGHPQDELKESQTAAVPAPAFIEKGSDAVTPEQKAALEAENAQLKQQLAEAGARDKATQMAAKHAANVAFAESLVQAGKMLPSQQAAAIATLDFIDSAEKVVEFGEGDAKQPLGEAFKAMLSATTKMVEFSEVAKPAAVVKTVEFAAADGFSVDSERLEQHQRALGYQAQHKVTYEAALSAVSV